MRAKKLSDLLKAGDRVAVSNITGREASVVSIASQKYCRNIVGGCLKKSILTKLSYIPPLPLFMAKLRKSSSIAKILSRRFLSLLSMSLSKLPPKSTKSAKRQISMCWDAIALE